MQAPTSLKGLRATHAQALGPRRLQTRRKLHRLCALPLERSTEKRKSKASPTPPSAAALEVVELDVDGVQLAEDVRRAYEAGYKAGLAAARQGQDAEAGQARPQHDSLFRSIVKALSWRFFSTATTIALTMTFFSASLDEALEMGAAEFLSKYLLYLVHERLWILVTWL